MCEEECESRRKYRWGICRKTFNATKHRVNLGGRQIKEPLSNPSGGESLMTPIPLAAHCLYTASMGHALPPVESTCTR